MVHPNNKQKARMFHYANAARFAYNWAIKQEKNAHESGERFLSAFDLNYKFVDFKKQKGNEWLRAANSEAMNAAIGDAVTAFKRFFKLTSKYPNFKSKKKSRPSFYQPTKKIKITEAHVTVQGIGKKKGNRLVLNKIKLAQKNRIPIETIYHNPRFTYDGLNWWFSVSVEELENQTGSPTTDGIGIDLGLKELAVVSNGAIYPNINKTNDTIKTTERRLKRKQRRVSRKYRMNKNGNEFVKTKNIYKAEKEILKLHHRLNNIRLNNIHHITKELTRTKPEFIVMEDLNVKGIMKNRHLAKSVAQQLWGEFYRQMQYKSERNGIKFVTADKWFPSSKMCSECGAIKTNLKLSERIYKCDCGNKIDRDLNAAVNLKNYGLQVS